MSSFKYLGITLQDNLEWNLHIDSTYRKIIGIASIMNRLGIKIHHALRISFYYAMINSHLAYLLPVWDTSATLNDISLLQVAQNQAIRKIFPYKYYHLNISTSEIMHTYKILNIRQLILHNLQFMGYKIDKCLMKCRSVAIISMEPLFTTTQHVIERVHSSFVRIWTKKHFS